MGRVRERHSALVKVRVRRRTHQLLMCRAKTLKRVNFPKGWMSPQSYKRYLRVTLLKMHARLARKRRQEHRHE
jgi:hypothetical protein